MVDMSDMFCDECSGFSGSTMALEVGTVVLGRGDAPGSVVLVSMVHKRIRRRMNF